VKKTKLTPKEAKRQHDILVTEKKHSVFKGYSEIIERKLISHPNGSDEILPTPDYMDEEDFEIILFMLRDYFKNNGWYVRITQEKPFNRFYHFQISSKPIKVSFLQKIFETEV